MQPISSSRLLLSLTVIFALVSTVGAQDASTPLPKFSPDQLREDFQIARRSLEEGHSGIYRYTPKAELDRVFDAVSKSLDRPMDAVEFFRVLAPAVAAVKCGHTNVTLPEAFRKEINNTFPLLPFQVRVLKGRV